MRAVLLFFAFLYPLGCSLVPALAVQPILNVVNRPALASEQAKLRRLLADYSNQDIGHLSRQFYEENGLSVLLAEYANIAYVMTFDSMPERDLKPWHFGSSLNGIWSDFDNWQSATPGLVPYLQKYSLKNSQDFRRHFLNECFKGNISLRRASWFYDLTNSKLIAVGAKGLLSKFKDSAFDLLDAIYPQKDLKPWLFKKSLLGIWKRFDSVEEAPASLRRYLARHQLSTSADFHRHILSYTLKSTVANNPTDWFYSLGSETLQGSGLENLIASAYNSSFIEMLYTLYPEKRLRPWLFKTGILGMWKEFDSVEEAPKALRSYLQQYGLNTNIEFQRHVIHATLGVDLANYDTKDFYRFSLKEDYDNELRTLMDYRYGGSWFLMLSTLYPEKDLKPWRFRKAPLGMWSDFESVEDAPPALQPYLKTHSLINSFQLRRHIMDDVFKVDVAAQPEEWFYSPTIEVLAAHKLRGLIKGVYGNSPQRMMLALYPEKDLDPSRFRTKPKHVSEIEMSGECHAVLEDSEV